ncbi:MAG: alanine/glycine:cation symporter family protein [Geminicoccaceae bacterium]
MTLETFVNEGNNILWGRFGLIALLLFTGAYFTLRSSFVQVRHFGHMWGVLKDSLSTPHGGVSSFGALSMSLAARVGTGNIAGVAVALTLGGPGAVFWMWVVALIGMATSFYECTLAQVFKIQDEDGTYRGGPAYYMERGLGQRWMGVLFAIFLIISFGFVFIAVQTNTIASAVNEAFAVDELTTGIIVAIVAGVVIFGGVRRIASVAEIIVPFMALAYLIIALIVIAFNIEKIPGILLLIVQSAFGIGEMAGGAVGYAISQAMLNGIKRGLFSNEAGMGSAPNAAATADVPHPAIQGYVQMLGVFVDTIVICTCTASIILLAGVYTPGMDMAGVTLTQESLGSEVGAWGPIFVAIALIFFAFTSVIANYYYGESNMLFIYDHHHLLIVPFRVLVLACIIAGAVTETPLIWSIADLSMACMAVLNLIAILLLSNLAMKVHEDYERQRHELRAYIRDVQRDPSLASTVPHRPVFDPSRFPELEDKIDDRVWQNGKL